LVALDKLTGERIWQSSDFTDPAQYASPIVVEVHGNRQYVQLTETSVVGIQAEDGGVAWRAEWPGSTAVIPTPIWRAGHLYATSGYGAGCNLFKIDPLDHVEALYDDEARKVMKNQHGGVVLVGEQLYGYSDSAGWVCQEWLSGKPLWRERSLLGKGAIVSAGGMLYCLTEEEGIVALVEPSPAGWSEISRFTLEPTSQLRSPSGGIWSHPVVANGKLYVRDQELLFCFDVRQESH
jgi:outer membrane protein assembly factor BamB